MRKSSASLLFFFFQAEDGIRDATVTGVQTCALPISRPCRWRRAPAPRPPATVRRDRHRSGRARGRRRRGREPPGGPATPARRAGRPRDRSVPGGGSAGNRAAPDAARVARGARPRRPLLRRPPRKTRARPWVVPTVTTAPVTLRSRTHLFR